MRGRVAAGSVRGSLVGGRVLRGSLSALTAIATVLLLAGGAAQAQAQRRGGPCAQEMRKLCPDHRPGSEGFRECFEQHKDELTPQCQERLAQGQERVEKMRAACETEIETHCSEAGQGGGRLMQCLNRHFADLSDGCKQAMPRRPRTQRAPGNAPMKAPKPAPEMEQMEE